MRKVELLVTRDCEAGYGLYTSLDETIRCASKWFIPTNTNLDFVDLKCVSYARTIPLPFKEI